MKQEYNYITTMLNTTNTTNTSNNNFDRPIMDHLPLGWWREFFGVLFVCTAIVAVFVNGCVLFMMYVNRSLRSPSNTILAALAFVDFVTGLAVAPLYAVQLLHTDVAKLKSVEEVRRTVAAILILTSSNIVGFISFDRCLHLVKLSNYKMNRTKLYGGIICCWLIPLLTPALRLRNDKERAYSIAFNIELFSSLFIILVFYLIVVKYLHRYVKNQSSLVQHSYMENQRRATRTVAMILLLYILMNLPITVNRVFVILGGMDMELLAKSYVIGSIFFVNSSVVNPVVYCMQTPLLRKKFIELFVGRNKKRRRHHETTFTVTPVETDQIHFSPLPIRGSFHQSIPMKSLAYEESGKISAET